VTGRWLARVIPLLLVAVTIMVAPARSAGDDSRFEADGRVLSVDEENRYLAVAHGPIPGLMPAMNMRFVVADAALLRGLQRGDQIRFVLELRDGEWTVTAVEVGVRSGRP